VTPGDPGGATNNGWTFATWQSFAAQHGLDPSFAKFQKMQKGDLEGPDKQAFWNHVQGDRLPAGVDIIWTDFQFGSYHATAVIQALLGVTADNVVGDQTVAAALAFNDKAAFLQQMTDASKAYYKTLVVYPEFGGGWNRRADARLALAQKLFT